MPCLLFNGSSLVKTVRFSTPDYVGDPVNAIKIYNEKEVDELIFLDINATREKRKPYFDKIKKYASECFMPLTYGGGVSEIDDFKKLYSIGVEKVAVSSILFSHPKTVTDAVKLFGSQAVVGVLNTKTIAGKVQVYNHVGYNTTKTIEEYIDHLQNEIGVGEILFQNVDLEGTWSGFNIDLMKKIIHASKVPVIVLGGAGNVDDIKNAYVNGAQAVALGSMAVYQKKNMGVLIRFPKRKLIFQNE